MMHSTFLLMVEQFWIDIKGASETLTPVGACTGPIGFEIHFFE